MTARDNSIEYRPEIDGLRALAVIPVLLYHAQLGASGGFVGVDVFFVISGFLITSLLLKRMEAGSLNLLEFWERRIRRLFPALAVMTLVFLLHAIGSFVEIPCRRRGLVRSRFAVFLLASATASILLVLGIGISRFDGMGFRLPDAVLRFADGRFDFNPAFNSGVSLQDAEAGRFLGLGSKRPGDPIQLLVWGDSHAMAALPALDYICNEYSVQAFAATHSQTPPLLDYVPEGSFRYSLKGDAPAFGEAVSRFIRAHHIPNVTAYVFANVFVQPANRH